MELSPSTSEKCVVPHQQVSFDQKEILREVQKVLI